MQPSVAILSKLVKCCKQVSTSKYKTYETSNWSRTMNEVMQLNINTHPLRWPLQMKILIQVYNQLTQYKGKIEQEQYCKAVERSIEACMICEFID